MIGFWNAGRDSKQNALRPDVERPVGHREPRHPILQSADRGVKKEQPAIRGESRMQRQTQNPILRPAERFEPTRDSRFTQGGRPHFDGSPPLRKIHPPIKRHVEGDRFMQLARQQLAPKVASTQRVARNGQKNQNRQN
jgi:hypothetical protein